MKHQNNLAKLVVALMIAGLLLASCTKRPRDGSAQPPKSAIKLRRIGVPSRVLSIAGEVLAFIATGEAGRVEEVPISLRRLQGRFGDFKRALVFEYNKEGKVLSQQEASVLPDGAIAIKATSGNRYLVYPDLGQRFRDTYVVACNLRNARLPAQLVPRICTQILCTDNFFKASQLKERIPELKNQNGLADLGDGVLGGFGGSGDICDQCLHPSEPDGDFLPAPGCFQKVPVTPDPPTGSDQIVFWRFPGTVDPPSNPQIFKLNADGTEVNLSNNENFETSPDVNHRTKKIVFSSSDGGLLTMDLNGGNRTVIPDAFLGGDPRWSRNDESFIVFTNLVANVDNSLHRVRLDGSDNVEIVKALPGNVVRTADLVDDNHVIYWQSNTTTKGDLFIKDMRNSDPAVNLTNTKDRDERVPVVSHSGSLIAFMVQGGTGPDEIHVARLTLPSTLTEIRVIHLSAPAGLFIRSFDFFSDDSGFVVSAGVIETEGTTNTIQLFSINLDGSGQVRLTFNDDDDFDPSVVTH